MDGWLWGVDGRRPPWCLLYYRHMYIVCLLPSRAWRKGQLKVRWSGRSMNWSWKPGRRLVLEYAMSLFRNVSPRTFCSGGWFPVFRFVVCVLQVVGGMGSLISPSIDRSVESRHRFDKEGGKQMTQS